MRRQLTAAVGVLALVGRATGGRPDEAPRHAMEVSAFVLDPTLVTRADFDIHRSGFGAPSAAVN